MYFAHIVPCYL